MEAINFTDIKGEKHTLASGFSYKPDVIKQGDTLSIQRYFIHNNRIDIEVTKEEYKRLQDLVPASY